MNYEKIIYGLKGRHNLAQGNALSLEIIITMFALKGQHKLICQCMMPFQGVSALWGSFYPGRCPGLYYTGLSGHNHVNTYKKNDEKREF